MKVSYSSNNSGGHWWLKDKDWKNLEKAGWTVEWAKDNYYKKTALDSSNRWLGALATAAYKDFPTIKMAIAEWEHVTGQNADDEGCHCCGRPHEFYKER